MIVMFAVMAVASATASGSHPPRPATPAISTPSPRPRIAPADEYFGGQRMSTLGIRNTIIDVRRAVDENKLSAPEVQAKLRFCEDAMLDWERKFPTDPWINRDEAALANAYASFPEGQKRSVAVWKHLAGRTTSDSEYGRLARARIATALARGASH